MLALCSNKPVLSHDTAFMKERVFKSETQALEADKKSSVLFVLLHDTASHNPFASEGDSIRRLYFD